MSLRRLLGALLLTWCTVKLVVAVATRTELATEFDALLVRWWPLVLLIAAAAVMANSIKPRPAVVFATLLGLIGAVALIETTGALHDSPWVDAWLPLALLPLGWLLLAGASRHGHTTDNWMRFAVLGRSRVLRSSADDLVECTGTVLAGHATLDMRAVRCVEIQGLDWGNQQHGHGALLSANVVLGSIDVIVPPSWFVDTSLSSPSARISNSTVPPQGGHAAGRLNVAAFTLGGGVTIRN